MNGVEAAGGREEEGGREGGGGGGEEGEGREGLYKLKFHSTTQQHWCIGIHWQLPTINIPNVCTHIEHKPPHTHI